MIIAETKEWEQPNGATYYLHLVTDNITGEVLRYYPSRHPEHPFTGEADIFLA